MEDEEDIQVKKIKEFEMKIQQAIHSYQETGTH